MKIKLTADTRVLLSAGTVVEVSKETAAVILKLGRCELFEEKAVEKADVAEDMAPKAEKPKAAKKKATKKTD